MLRTDYPFPLSRWPARFLAWLLGEPLLGFLAILATGLTLFPMLFDLGPAAAATLEAAQWLIIAWFAVEYFLAFAFAPQKAAFLRNPWRLLDLATIVIPLASLLPSVSHALRSSPVLRLVRLVRLVTLGVRASGIVVRHHTRDATAALVHGPAQITLVADAPAVSPAPARWEELLRWLRARDEAWFDVANPSPDELAQLAAAAGLPAGFLETNFVGAAYPHLATTPDCTALFLWMPESDAAGRTERHARLFLVWEKSLLSLSRRGPAFAGHIQPGDASTEAAGGGPYPLRLLLGELARAVRCSEILAVRFEQELHALEDVPVRESRPEFFERTFRVKKELSAAQSDLWRLKNVLSDLAERRVRLPGMTDADAEPFGRLAATVVYLYETILNIREEVLSVIELHLNVVSFDMNRVMRVLAVVSVLGLVPAVVGGLFGMNLIDNPWPFTLAQVAFAICFAMVVGLYLFFVKGWLR